MVEEGWTKIVLNHDCSPINAIITDLCRICDDNEPVTIANGLIVQPYKVFFHSLDRVLDINDESENKCTGIQIIFKKKNGQTLSLVAHASPNQ
jgi:hypothetical protein